MVARYDEDVSWLLEESEGTSGRPIIPTQIYQIADIGSDCEPAFPSTPSGSPTPSWPAWARHFAAAKCAVRGEVEPMSLEDSERQARLTVGLPWTKSSQNTAHRHRHLQQASFDASDPPKPAKSMDELRARLNATLRGASDMRVSSVDPSIVTLRSLSPLPLRLIPAIGRESMAYLTAIIDNYDALPDLMLFMHGHDVSWHSFEFGQRWMLRRLASLPPRNLSNGFMQLGCIQRDESFIFPRVISANYKSLNGQRWKEVMAGFFAQSWREHLGAAFGGAPLPSLVKAACCASFAVTREAVQRRPRAFYEGLRGWLLTTPQDKYWAGVSIEFSWHMAFTGMAVYDPPVEQCRKELYDI